MIEDDAFIGLHSLTSLELPNCGLKNMPPLAPINSKLEKLNLSWNMLINISVKYFMVSSAWNMLV